MSGKTDEVREQLKESEDDDTDETTDGSEPILTLDGDEEDDDE